MYKKFLLSLVQLILLALTIYFVYRLAGNLFTQIDLSTALNSPDLVVLSVTLFGFFYAVLAFHWQYVTRLVSNQPNHNQWLAFLASQPYKYLPSSVFTFSSRAKFSKDLGLSFKNSSKAQLIENFNLIGSAVSLSVLLVVFLFSWLLGVTLGILGVTVLFLIHRFSKKIKVNLKKIRFEIYPSKWVPAFLLCMAAWLVAGFAFVAIVSIYTHNTNILAAIAANAAAFAAGIVAVFAPGGIGVRELVFTYFSIVGAGIVLWRLLTLVMDITVGSIAVIWIRRLKQQNPK